MEKGHEPTTGNDLGGQAERHGIVQYALLEQPRPGNRETRMREIGGGWLQRNDRPEGTT